MSKDPNTMTLEEIQAEQKRVGDELGKFAGDWMADRDPRWHELQAEKKALADAYLPAMERAGEETALRDAVAAAEAEERAQARAERINAALEARRK